MNSWYHACSSARKWGGRAEDYLAIHERMDVSKQSLGDVRHRALYHHTEGIWTMQDIFGPTLTILSQNGRERQVPVREICERHVIEDLGWIPSFSDYVNAGAGMPIATWMSGAQKRELPLSTLLLKPSNEPTTEGVASV